MKTFGGITSEFASLEHSSVLLQAIPYDGTSTWGKGADKGFDVFLDASENMELFDIETNSEVYKRGIHILPEIRENSSPEAVYKKVKSVTTKNLEHGKFLTSFGGEHAISIGIIEAFSQRYPNLTVLQLDAHADLRESYLGSKYNHACAMHAASQETNLIQVGIRSMDSSELACFNRAKCFLAEDMVYNHDWMDLSVKLMTDDVYISLDLDVFDPSIMPDTGTPEPGGMLWYETLIYLKKVFGERNVVGFDIVEFAPLSGLKSPGFMVSKLYYKMLSYKFENGK